MWHPIAPTMNALGYFEKLALLDFVVNAELIEFQREDRRFVCLA